MSGRDPTQQALLRLEGVAEETREAEIELRKARYYPAEESRRHLSVAAATLVDADLSLQAVLEMLGRAGAAPLEDDPPLGRAQHAGPEWRSARGRS